MQWPGGLCVGLQSAREAAMHTDDQLTSLARLSQVQALSRPLLFESADSDEPLCTQFHRASMPSRRAVVHAIRQYAVGDAVARKDVSQLEVCQRMEVIGRSK